MPSININNSLNPRDIEEWSRRQVGGSYGYYPQPVSGYRHHRRSIIEGRPYWIDRQYYNDKYSLIVEHISKESRGVYLFRIKIRGPNNHNFSQNNAMNRVKKGLYEDLKESKPFGCVFKFVDLKGNFIEEV